jgi:hypothetical protein
MATPTEVRWVAVVQFVFGIMPINILAITNALIAMFVA